MRNKIVLLAAMFLLGLFTAVGTLAARQTIEGVTVPVMFAIQDANNHPLIGTYTVTILRAGSRYERIVAHGQSDRSGYIRTRVVVPCPNNLKPVLEPLIK